MPLPETRYAMNNGLHVAYQLTGDGPMDVVLLTQWFSNVDSQWDVPPLAEFIGRLARFGRVLTFDKRGTGLSDPVSAEELPSIEEWMDDLRAVLDENAIERAVLVANLASSFMALVFAATYPSRVRTLVLVNAYPRFTQDDADDQLHRRQVRATDDRRADAGDLTGRSGSFPGWTSWRGPGVARTPPVGAPLPPPWPVPLGMPSRRPLFPRRS